jgi:3-oxoacyl-(acyl-carrier-protein) synthase
MAASSRRTVITGVGVITPIGTDVGTGWCSLREGRQLAVAGAERALEDGKVDKTRLDPTRFGVAFGAGLIASELQVLADAARVSANCRCAWSYCARASGLSGTANGCGRPAAPWSSTGTRV